MVRIVIEVCGAALLVWGWCKALQGKHATMSLAYYIAIKGYAVPTDEEMLECKDRAARDIAKKFVGHFRA